MFMRESGKSDESIKTTKFHEYLNEMINSKSLSKIEVMKKAKLNKNYGYQIFNGTRRPSRDKVIELGIAMELDIKELNYMLEKCSHARLFPKERRDAAIIYFLEKGFDVEKINEVLETYGEKKMK